MITLFWFVLSYILLANFYLVYRFLSIKFGRKIQPDARKAILITGATSGIGLNLAKNFFKSGFTIVACYFNDKEPGYDELLTLSRSINHDTSKRNDGPHKQDPKLFLVHMDVRSEESVKNSVDQVDSLLDEHNIKLHFLINNAGIATDGSFEWSKMSAMKDVIDTNLMGTILVTRHFILKIIKNKGRVINVSSAIIIFPTSTFSIYGSTKAAIAYFSQSLNADIRNFGASCVFVAPGNYINQSNIIYTRIKGVQESIKALSDEEKILYKSSLRSFTSFLDSILRAKLRFTHEDPEHIADFHKIDLTEALAPRTGPKRNPSLSKRIKNNIFLLFSGGSELNLGQIDTIEAFRDAVLLKSPPSRLYAGTFLFSYVIGPFIETLPYSLTCFVGSWLETFTR